MGRSRSRRIEAELIGGPEDGKQVDLIVSATSEAIRYSVPDGECRDVYGGLLRVDRPFVRLEYLGRECDSEEMAE